MPLRLRAPDRPPPAPDDDRALLDRFVGRGDQAAFAAIVARHGPLVLGVCRRVVRDPHLADDAFQAVFVVLARKARTVATTASLASWLFGVARRVALAARRKEFRARSAEVGARSGAAKPDPSPDWDDLLRVLDDELARLSEKLRTPVVECFFREKTQDEAARALGWSLSTLRRRLDRAKDVLRARLTARGVALPAALFAGALAASTATAQVPPALAQAATTAASGGTVTASVAAFANGGMAMSMTTKVLAVAAVVAATGGTVAAVAMWRPVPDTPATATAPPAAPPVVAPPKAEAPPAPAPSPPPAPSAEWAAVRGRVVWPASLPVQRPPVNVTTDKPHCEMNGPLVQEDVIVNPKNGGVRYVIAWLRPDNDDRRAPFPKDRVKPDLVSPAAVNHVVDQPCCQFVPRVVAARVGDTVEFRNSAAVNHNINYASDAEPFNVNLPPGGPRKTAPLAPQTSPIPFKCDIHPWMAGRVRVFDHPYFAVTDADGNFAIPDAPVGKWRLVYWHENGYHKGRDGLLGFPVEVTAGGVTLPPVALELPK